MNITIDDLISHIKLYNPGEEDIIRKAYEYANYLHAGQTGQSGEPQITHPLNVVYILSDMHADRLHNMRTLSFKSEFKQKENSLETMEIFVPLVYYISAYRINK